MRKGLWAPLGSLASWDRRERRATLATPLEGAGGSQAPQGCLGPLDLREKRVWMARPAPEDSKETRGSQEKLENKDPLAPRAPRENPGKEKWWITMETSMKPSRRSGHWP